MKRTIKKILLVFLVLILVLIGYFSIGSAPQSKEITFGVNFSQKHAENLGLDWQETYLALLDIGVKKIKLVSYWDVIEKEKDRYDFADLSWQIKEAEKRGVEIILVIGMKVPRWPECHLPSWAENLVEKEQQERILKLIEKIVFKYKDRISLKAWQVENEPFFPFGECPWIDKDFLKKEIALVKSLDTRAAAKGEEEDLSSSVAQRPIIISDSGEFSFWLTAAQLGDVIGTTLHRRVWSKELKIYITHHWFQPIYYWRKAQIIDWLFDKKVFVGELQAEPWCFKHLGLCSLSQQEKTMNLDYFKDNIEFARKTGLKEFYLWGGEWWYWLKEVQNQPEIWNEAKKLFNKNL